MKEQLFPRSPHIELVLRNKVTVTELIDLADIYARALNAGGDREIGFSRDEGQSYNPRLARVGLILLNDGGISAPDVLGAAFLACVGSNFRNGAVIDDLAALACGELSALMHSDAPSAIAIRAALTLDRARHFHLEDSPDLNFLDEVALLAEKSREAVPAISFLLVSWLDRYHRLRSLKN